MYTPRRTSAGESARRWCPGEHGLENASTPCRPSMVLHRMQFLHHSAESDGGCGPSYGDRAVGRGTQP